MLLLLSLLKLAAVWMGPNYSELITDRASPSNCGDVGAHFEVVYEKEHAHAKLV